MKNITTLASKQLQEANWISDATYDIETDTYTIPKRIEDRFDVGKCYIIELDDKLLIKGSDPVLEANWNNGRTPLDKYYQIEVLNTIGKMIQVFGVAYNIEEQKNCEKYWKGYLPKDKIKIIQTL